MNYLEQILAQAQQGQAFENLASAYGISPEQARQATEAVLPAFALGLERSTQTPQNFAELLGAMSRNPYGDAFNNSGFGFGGDVRAQGNDALAVMFGSPDVSRAVAAQAAANTGLSSALLKQMLPAIAAMVMGGLMKGGGGTASGAGGGGGLGDLLGGILGGGAQGQQPRQANAGGGSGNPLQDLLGGILGGGSAGTGGGQPRPGAGNPLDDLLGGMLGGGRAGAPQSGGASNPLEDILGGLLGGGPQSRPQRAPEPDPTMADDSTPPPERAGSGNPLEDLLGSILGGGASQPRQRPGTDGGQPQSQDPRMQPFQDIFDQFFSGRR